MPHSRLHLALPRRTDRLGIPCFRLRRGLDLPLAGAPEQVLHDGPPITRVAVLPDDAPGLKPVLDVAEGDRVALGAAVYHDRADPRLLVTAPGAGVVRAIHRGARRRLHAIEIELEGDERLSFGLRPRETLAYLPRDELVAVLLSSGLWCALRTRPFGKVPRPDAVPAALFVTALATDPLAADPVPILAGRGREFAAGLDALGRLTDGPVHLCTAPDAELPRDGRGHVVRTAFAGPHPAGLPGTHVHLLAPVDAEHVVWTLGCQEVIAIGALLLGGRLPVERVVALGGPAVRHPRLVRTRTGAGLDELLADELHEGPCRVISGSVLSGRTARGHRAFLGRHDSQVTVLPEPGAGTGRRRGSRRRFSAHVPLPWSARRPLALTPVARGVTRPMLPQVAFEQVLPLDLLPTPLLRALLVGDDERAEALGALELVEEDLALCTVLDAGRNDYGRLLRATLDRLEKQT